MFPLCLHFQYRLLSVLETGAIHSLQQDEDGRNDVTICLFNNFTGDVCWTLLCCGATSSQEQGCLLAGDRSNACATLPSLHSPSFPSSVLWWGWLCVWRHCMRVSKERVLGGQEPGDPAPWREEKEDQVPALCITNIREILLGQASCLLEGKLSFGIGTHLNGDFCQNAPTHLSAISLYTAPSTFPLTPY